MKKFINPTVPTGGAPIFAQELVSEVLTVETWKAIEATLASLDFNRYAKLFDPSDTFDNCIVSGGVITGSDPYTISAGIAYFKSAGGIFAEFPLTSGLVGSTFYVTLNAQTIEQKIFFDSGLKDYFTIQTASVGIAVPGDANAVKASGSNASIMNLQVFQDGITGGSFTRKFDIGTWDMNFSAGGDQVRNIDLANIAFDVDNIMSVQAWVREDPQANRQHFNFEQYDPLNSNAAIGKIEIQEDTPSASFTRIKLTIVAGSFLDGTNYNSTSDSRGWVVIHFNDPDAVI